MASFLDGQQNLAALSVPGVYVDIVPPQPFLTGVPTNIMGVVGVASWGPVNAPVNFSGPDSCAVVFGTAQVRKYDMPTYVLAASQVGTAIGYAGVRVSDGTDVAATNTVGTGGTYASGTVTFSANPTNADTLTINGTVITFTSANKGATLAATLQILLAELQNSADTNLVACTYSLSGSVLTVKAAATGTAGNSITLAKSSTAITLSGATLSGGAGSGGTGVTITAKYTGTLGNQIRFNIVTGSAPNSYMAIVSFPGRPPEQFNNITGAGNTFWVNLAAAINSGSTTRGPSNFIVAAAGAATAAPTLNSPVTLAGGTDGASGVTDATLLGVDTTPRTGMYALRRTGIDGFAMCDHSTSAHWAAADAFALSENCFFVTATVSGDSISNAASTRVSAALDDYFTWLAVGDFPTFMDTQNGYPRQINPAAFMLGWAGNASPEQSPLNKQLRGIVATQRTVAGLTYSDAELSIVENGGLDIIVGPPTTPGGYYFTFISGRNASSNTAANGIEWTRLTNWLARSFQQKAAGSIVGRLQTNKEDDRTRADAKALIDGFLASIKDPAVGSRGNGIIEDYATVCDLSNNPLQLQQRGFLFIYVAVKYMNVVRYFVIKLAGGGSVNVTTQSTPPQVAQYF